MGTDAVSQLSKFTSIMLLIELQLGLHGRLGVVATVDDHFSFFDVADHHLHALIESILGASERTTRVYRRKTYIAIKKLCHPCN